MHYTVVDARYVRDYVIWVKFEDGTQGEVDLSTELWGRVFEPLKDVGFFRNFTVADKEKAQPTLRIDLKYSEDGEPVIHGIERISRPGRRVYRNKQEIPRVLGGLGLAIVSTSKGVLAGHEAVKSGVGGEVLCQVW